MATERKIKSIQITYENGYASETLMMDELERIEKFLPTLEKLEHARTLKQRLDALLK
ncbi:hypothetical protein ES705_26856 [subsurface metagenome]